MFVQQGVDLRVKWPNDIYYGSTLKLGGVLLKSSLYNDQCTVLIGKHLSNTIIKYLVKLHLSGSANSYLFAL